MNMISTMDLCLYNSLSKSEVIFNTKSNNKLPLLLYVCGVTVYNDAHIGNLRPLMIADMLIRFFKKNKLRYKYMQSLTDISDKIEQASRENHCSETEVSQKYELKYKKLISMMGFIKADFYAKPSAYIGEISLYINKLIEKKYAYRSNGNVFFNVKADSQYGEFSRKNISKNITTTNKWTDLKEDEHDFALWKAPHDAKQNVYYSDSLNYGRPGWHIECSVMAAELFRKYQRSDVDICIGGSDLIFPHNENMLVQHRAIYKKSLAKCWINVGQVKLNEKKMAKSTGNYYLAKDIINKYSPDCVRYLLLKSAHQKSLDITNELIAEASKKVSKWKVLLKNKAFLDYINNQYISTKYNEYICNNLNTSQLFRQINYDIRQFNKMTSTNQGSADIYQIVNEINYCFWLIGLSFAV